MCCFASIARAVVCRSCRTLGLRIHVPSNRHFTQRPRLALAFACSLGFCRRNRCRRFGHCLRQSLAHTTCVHACRSNRRPILVYALRRFVVPPGARNSLSKRSDLRPPSSLAAVCRSLVRVNIPCVLPALLRSRLAALFSVKPVVAGSVASSERGYSFASNRSGRHSGRHLAEA